MNNLRMLQNPTECARKVFFFLLFYILFDSFFHNSVSKDTFLNMVLFKNSNTNDSFISFIFFFFSYLNN